MTNDNNFATVFPQLIPTNIDQEDVIQENELRRLEGRPQHIMDTRRELGHKVPELFFGDHLPVSASKIELFATPMSSKDYEKLIEYLFNTDISEEIILNFLNNPLDETALKKLVGELYKRKVFSKKTWVDTKPKEKSLRIIILDILKQRDFVTQTEIFDIVEAIHPSKRPASAARISIKRLLNSKDIEEINDKVYKAIKY